MVAALLCDQSSCYYVWEGSLLMADIICHGTEGGLMILALLRSWIARKSWPWVLVGLGLIFGMLPDLIGAYGNIVDHDHWTLYRSAHFGPIKQILQYVPMYGLHLFLDSLMHGQGHRWWRWDERMWLEILLWVVNAMVILWLVRTWKKDESDEQGVVPFQLEE